MDWSVIGGPLRCELGESPVWAAIMNRLVVVDVTGFAVHRIDPEGGGVESVALSRRITAVIPRTGGGWLAVAGRDIVDLDLVIGTFENWLTIAGPEDVPLNDAVVGRDGVLYTGSLDRSGARRGELYAIDPCGGVARLAAGVGASNGVDTSPDGRIIYHADTFAGTVTAYTTAGGGGAVRLAHVAVERPDGLAVDAEGGVWVALWGSGAIQRYSAELVPDRRVPVPVPLVSNVAFGGPDLRTLFVTTARSDGDPLSGAVLATPAPLPGLPPATFAN